MKKKYITYAGIIAAGVLIIMFIAIFFSGPFLNNGTTNRTTIVTANESLPSLSSQMGSCGGPPSRFISIDPLPDIFMNHSYTITGTTSLPSGEELFAQVLPLEYEFKVNPKNQSMTGKMSGAVEIVTVVNGTGRVNLWSFDLNTGRLDSDARNYFINISNSKFDPKLSAFKSGDTFCIQSFTVR